MLKRKNIIYLLAALWLVVGAGCTGGPAATEESESHNDEKQSEREMKEDRQKPAEEDPAAEKKKKEQEEKREVKKERLKKEPQYRVNEANWTAVPIKDAVSKTVLLTIDDAPDKYALEMAQTLAELEAGAIFFVNGHFLQTEEQKEILKKIHELGFPIGNHTYSHANLKELPEKKQREEIIKVNRLVEEIIGEKPEFFRAPFGSNTDYSRKVAEKEGMVIMNWTFGYDWEKEYQNKKALKKIMLTSPYLTDGAILLMHDRKWTNEAIADIVKGYKKKGYTILDPDLLETK